MNQQRIDDKEKLRVTVVKVEKSDKSDGHGVRDEDVTAIAVYQSISIKQSSRSTENFVRCCCSVRFRNM